MFRVQNKLNCIFLAFKLLKMKNDKTLKLYKSQINLVKMSNEDPRVINEKCKCQNENVIMCVENESEMKP